MKKNLLLIVALSALSLSCNGFKKGARYAYKEYQAASKSDAVRYLKSQNRKQMAEDLYNDYIASSPCSTCNGYGVVYEIDSYGNAITDGYGNVQLFFCPDCGGNGQ